MCLGLYKPTLFLPYYHCCISFTLFEMQLHYTSKNKNATPKILFEVQNSILIFMTQNGKKGRPRAASPRNQISLTISPEAREYLEVVAEQQGLTISEYVRLKVFNSSDTRQMPVGVLFEIDEPPPSNWKEYRQRVANKAAELSWIISAWSDHLTAKDKGLSLDEYRDKSKSRVPEYLQSFNQEQRRQFWDFMKNGMTKEQALLELQKQLNLKP